MKPTKNVECKLVDLLDRILDKGIILNADVIISIAGIPLIGINLRAALAGIETMLDYGMVEAWDESTRKYYADEISKKKVPLMKGEKIILQTFGSHYYSNGIYSVWRLGYLYLTNKRLFLFRKEPPEILFETPLEGIKGLMLKKGSEKERENLYVLLETDEVAILHTEDVKGLKKTIKEKAKEKNLKGEFILPEKIAPKMVAI